jgi:hypothetical protein
VRTKLEDVQGVLSNVCCVVSQRESTLGKICANSVNCPIHAMDQRHEVRRILFGADALPPVVPVKKKKKKKAPVVVVPTVSVAAAASNNPAAAAAAAPLGVVGGAAPRVLLAAAAPPPQVLVHPQHRPPQHHQHHPHAAVGVHLDLDDMAMLPGGANTRLACLSAFFLPSFLHAQLRTAPSELSPPGVYPSAAPDCFWWPNSTNNS